MAITCVVKGRPSKNNDEQTTNKTAILRLLKRVIFSSMIAVMTVSTLTNCVLMPSMIIMRKNKMDHNGEIGKYDMASGFTINVSPMSEKENKYKCYTIT